MKVINFFNNLHFEIYIWHEICLMSWNPADFSMKSARYHMQMRQFAYEIHWISWPWNLPNFMVMKSAEFHHEIHQISWPWNLPNFMKSARFHGHEIRRISSWNPASLLNEPRTNGPIFSSIRSCWLSSKRSQQMILQRLKTLNACICHAYTTNLSAQQIQYDVFFVPVAQVKNRSMWTWARLAFGK